MDPLLIVAILAVVVAGLVAYAFRLGAQLRSAETKLAGADERASQADMHRMMLAETSKERDMAREEAAALRPFAERCARQEEDLTSLRAEKEGLAATKAAYERGEAERAQAFEKQLAQIKELEAKLESRFGALAGEALKVAHDDFLKRAAERLSHEGQQNEAKFKALLQPMEDSLKKNNEWLQGLEKEREGSYRELKEVVGSLAQGNDLVRRETARLANVMRSSPKARGRWGEEQLRTILEAAGLAENIDFDLQTTVSDGDRQLRPDCIIKLPGNKCIVIDVKCPLVAFEQAFDEEDEERRSHLLLEHAKALKSYAKQLGQKGYWRQFKTSPDFVVMFIPGEHFLSAASERAPDLIESAFKDGVIVASTINMLALAKIMAGMWRQEQLAEEAQRIGELGKDLYAALRVMAEHVHRLGSGLNTATSAYDSFVTSLESNVLSKGRKFEALKLDGGGKLIPTLPDVNGTTKTLTRLVSSASEEAA